MEIMYKPYLNNLIIDLQWIYSRVVLITVLLRHGRVHLRTSTMVLDTTTSALFKSVGGDFRYSLVSGGS